MPAKALPVATVSRARQRRAPTPFPSLEREGLRGDVLTMAGTTLVDRALIRLSGEDVRAFLQGLVTNDIDALAPGRRSGRVC